MSPPGCDELRISTVAVAADIAIGVPTRGALLISPRTLPERYAESRERASAERPGPRGPRATLARDDRATFVPPPHAGRRAVLSAVRRAARAGARRPRREDR